MKKSLYLLTLLILIVILAGCKSEVQQDESNIITPNINIDNAEKIGHITINSANLDDEEYTVISAVGVRNSMIFLIDMGDVKVNNISFWIDQYIDGEHENTFLNIRSQVFHTSSSSNYKIYFSNNGIDFGKEIWTMALRENKSISSGKYELESSEYDSTIIHPINKITTVLHKSTDLGMVVRNQGADLFGASDDVNRTIQENKEVYVIRCMFD